MCIKRCCDDGTWAVRLQLKMCRAFIDAAPTAPKDLHAPCTGVSSINFQLPVFDNSLLIEAPVSQLQDTRHDTDQGVLACML
jgi:hypothetical protein